MKFRKGHSGNPAGRPKGAKDKRTALRALLEPHADKLVKKAVELALSGDTTALRICIDRIIPPMKAEDRPIELGATDSSLTMRGQAVLAALCAGSISPDEAAAFMQAISAQARIVEVDELEKRVGKLERRHGT